MSQISLTFPYKKPLYGKTAAVEVSGIFGLAVVGMMTVIQANVTHQSAGSPNTHPALSLGWFSPQASPGIFDGALQTSLAAMEHKTPSGPKVRGSPSLNACSHSP